MYIRLKEICKIFKFVIRVLSRRQEDTCRELLFFGEYIYVTSDDLLYYLCVHFRNKDN